jgi:predicted membrane-bound mannosyltransferase
MKSTLPAHKSKHLRLWIQIGIVVALLAIILPLRLWRLAEAPPDFYYDEGAHGYDALRVAKGEHRPFFTTTTAAKP